MDVAIGCFGLHSTTPVVYFIEEIDDPSVQKTLKDIQRAKVLESAPSCNSLNDDSALTAAQRRGHSTQTLRPRDTRHSRRPPFVSLSCEL